MTQPLTRSAPHPTRPPTRNGSEQLQTGRPAPAISWRRAGKVIDESYLTLNDFLAIQMLTPAGQANRSSANPANGPPNDNNQPPDSINNLGPADSSLGQWSSWPEFDFFARDFQFGPHSAQPGRLEPTGSGAGRQLLDLAVDETITTAVNELRLGQVGRPMLISSSSGSPPSAPASPGPDLARLECHASNLHYDLRALIKLFAPPSLLAPANNAAGHRWHRKLSLRPAEPRRAQLAAAIELAVEGELSAAGQQLAGQQSPPGAGPLQEPLRQANPEAAPGQEPEEGQQANRWSEVLQQQVRRPHQLAQAQAASGEEPAASQQLVRSRLIALDGRRK